MAKVYSLVRPYKVQLPVTVQLTGVVEQEGEQYVSTCLELGTSSCGDTIEEAFSNLEEAISVHLDALREVAND